MLLLCICALGPQSFQHHHHHRIRCRRRCRRRCRHRKKKTTKNTATSACILGGQFACVKLWLNKHVCAFTSVYARAYTHARTHAPHSINRSMRLLMSSSNSDVWTLAISNFSKLIHQIFIHSCVLSQINFENSNENRLVKIIGI